MTDLQIIVQDVDGLVPGFVVQAVLVSGSRPGHTSDGEILATRTGVVGAAFGLTVTDVDLDPANSFWRVTARDKVWEIVCPAALAAGSVATPILVGDVRLIPSWQIAQAPAALQAYLKGDAGDATPIADQTLVGNVSGGSAIPVGLSVALVKALLAYGISDISGLVAALGGKVDTSDGRLTNARTPTAHAASHAAAGSDPVTVAAAQVTGLGTAAAKNIGDFDAAGAATTAVSGIPADGAAGVPSLRTLGTGATQAAAGSTLAGKVSIGGDLAGTSTSPTALASLKGIFGHSYLSTTVVTTTIKAAVDSAGWLNTYPTMYDGHPGRRRAVLIPPGTYNEVTLTLPPYIDLIGMTLNPADVTINATPGTDGIKVQGSNLLAGFTISQASGSGFPLHPVFNGRDAFLYMYRVNATSAGSDGACGAQILGTQTIYARECNFTSVNAYALYLHSFAPVIGKESTATFDRCTAISTGPTGISIIDENADPVSFAWVGGTIHGATVDVSLGVLTTASWYAQISTSAYSTITNNFGSTRLTDWPSGVPAPVPSYPMPSIYGGDTRGLPMPLLPLVTDGSPQTVTALRQYYWPVCVPSVCRIAKFMAGVGATVAGNVNILLYSSTAAGLPGVLITTSGSQTAVAGLMSFNPAAARVLIPGTYWLAIVFDSATVTPIASSTSHLVQQLYYQDVAALTTNPNPATPLAVTAGPVPIVTGRTN